MYPSVGSAEGFQTAVIDSPLYDRLLLRSLRRWVGLSDAVDMYVELDDGNGMFIHTGVSLD
jgi:hypothetical protein